MWFQYNSIFDVTVHMLSTTSLSLDCIHTSVNTFHEFSGILHICMYKAYDLYYIGTYVSLNTFSFFLVLLQEKEVVTQTMGFRSSDTER